MQRPGNIAAGRYPIAIGLIVAAILSMEVLLLLNFTMLFAFSQEVWIATIPFTLYNLQLLLQFPKMILSTKMIFCYLSYKCNQLVFVV